MTLEEHKERHNLLHKMFDELLGDFISNTSGGPSSTIMELAKWSHEQTKNPSLPKGTSHDEGRVPKDVEPGEEGQEIGEADGNRGQGDEGLRSSSSSESLP